MKWFCLPAVLIVMAASATADAGLLDRLEKLLQQQELNAPAEIDSETSSSDFAAPTEPPVFSGGPLIMKGPHQQPYPFNSCCQPQSACCDHMWRGYCGKRHGCRTLHWFKHCARRDACGWGHRRFKHHCGPSCGPCGPKGCGWGLNHARACDPCGHRHRLGLFDWLHFRKGHGCGKCGAHYPADCGCHAPYHYGGSKMIYGGSKTIYGGSKVIDGGEPSVAPHAVPDPAPIPAPAPGNSAQRRLFPRSLFQPASAR